MGRELSYTVVLLYSIEREMVAYKGSRAWAPWGKILKGKVRVVLVTPSARIYFNNRTKY